MTAVTRTVHSEQELLSLGAALSRAASAPAFFALNGDLGAGKSVLARGFLQERGADAVLSPTFTIVQVYPFTPCVYHLDAYRLSGSDELYATGYEDFFAQPSVILLEWADLVPDALPKERLDIQITGSGMEPRTVVLTPHGAVYERMVSGL